MYHPSAFLSTPHSHVFISIYFYHSYPLYTTPTESSPISIRHSYPLYTTPISLKNQCAERYRRQSPQSPRRHIERYGAAGAVGVGIHSCFRNFDVFSFRKRCHSWKNNAFIRKTRQWGVGIYIAQHVLEARRSTSGVPGRGTGERERDTGERGAQRKD